MGSKRKGKKPGQAFTTFQHWALKSEAFKAASGLATKLMMRLALRHNGANNGSIGLSVRHAADELRCTVNTASKAFAELERLRLIECVRKGSFSQKQRHASIWHLHWLPANGQTWEGFGPSASPFMQLPDDATAPRKKNARRSHSFKPMVSKHETGV